MKADLFFNNVHVYDVKAFDVLIDQPFEVRLDPEAVGAARWFSDNDPVLEIAVKDSGASATLKATAEGPCEIQIQDPSGAKLLTLQVNVFSNEAAGFKVPSPTIAEA